MSFQTYNRDIPDAPNNPSVDQPNMKTNTNAVDNLLAVDHINFNLNNGGYHKTVHQFSQGTWNAVARTGAPATIATVEQIFPLNYTPNFSGATADTQLFAKTGGGGVSQLTGNSSQTDGWQWIGGVLIQWGKVTTASSGSFSSGTASGTVTFKNRGPVSQGIPFPSTCYTITTTPLFRTNTPSGAASVGVETTGGGFDLTNTGFNWLFSSNSGDYRGFFWMAIGI